MRRLLVLVPLLFAAAAAAHAGMIIQEPADATRPQWLLDGHHVEVSWAEAANGISTPHEPYVVDDDGTGLRPAASGDVVAHPDLAVSPDGKQHAYFGADGNLWVGARRLTSGGDGDRYGWQPIAWSPDGSRIAFGWGESYGSAALTEIDVVPAVGGKRRRAHVGTSVAWIDAHTLAVGLEGYTTDIDRVDLRNGHASRLVSGYYSPGGFDVSPDGSQIVFTGYLGAAYDRGSVVYAASTRAADSDVRRLTPDTCTVKPRVYFSNGACLDGTNGPDRIVGTRFGDLILAGPGDDNVRAGDGGNSIEGQWGDDSIRSGNEADRIRGGAGADTIRSGGGDDGVRPGPGRDVVFAGRGSDHIVANDGERDVIDCGPGADSVRADAIDVTRNCEHVTHSGPESDQGDPA